MKTLDDHQHESIIIEKELSETQEITKETTSMVFSPVISPASSPSHEFSFTLSSVQLSTTETSTTSPTLSAEKHQPQPPLAIDLSPADDIFFHGHLLPLHFLSHLHASSPRSSTTSLDSFTLPVKETSQEDQNPAASNLLIDRDQINTTTQSNTDNLSTKENQNNKSKPFSLFGLAKWRKGSSDQTKEKQENKRKLKFDVSEFVKRYVKMVKPLLSPKGGSGGRRDHSYGVPRQSYSFSGSLTPKREGFRGSRGEFSAPASMITSPTNSGRILTVPTGVPLSPVSDSTMEELQSAIQAAIAHCKKSVSSDQGKQNQEILPVPVN